MQTVSLGLPLRDRLSRQTSCSSSTLVQELKATTERQAAVIALQEGQIAAVTGSIKQQAEQIQKVTHSLKSSNLRRKWSTIPKAGWSWGCVSAVNCNAQMIWIVDAHRDDGKRFVVRAG